MSSQFGMSNSLVVDRLPSCIVLDMIVDDPALQKNNNNKYMNKTNTLQHLPKCANKSECQMPQQNTI